MSRSIYNMDEPPPSKEERAGAKQDAVEYLRLWKKRALYATVAFFLSCAAVVPFSNGQSLHAYAEPFGRILVYLTMALFAWLVISVGVAINSWLFLRALKKGKL
jgi:hypothetical protein